MPNMPSPFVATLPSGKISKYDLIQAIRADIVGELEAIYLYDAHANATDDPLAKEVLADIRDEEKAHVGELMTLIRHLDPAEADHFEEGEGEVKEMMEKLGIDRSGAGATPPATVGSLK